MDKLDIYQEERPWGNFRKFLENSPATVKIITVKPNERLSLQSHNKREEFWHITRGSGTVEIGDATFEAAEGKEFQIGKGVKHRISAGPYGVAFLELAFGEFDEEGDIIRYEDRYGRA